MKRISELHFEEALFRGAEAETDAYLEVPPRPAAFIFAVVLASLVLAAVVAKVFYLNVIGGGFYIARAEVNMRRMVYIPAPRAVITDRYGEVIVGNTNSFSVILDLDLLLKDAHASAALEDLAGALHLSYEEILERIRALDVEQGDSLLLVHNITAEEAIAVRGLNALFVRVTDDYTREYPAATAFAHLIGYTGMDTKGTRIVGKVGIEAFYDERLRGTEGEAVRYEDALGSVFETRVREAPRAASEFRTTIDAQLQRYFLERLTKQLSFLGRKVGVGIALDPRTGDVLSLVNVPSFDNNAFVERGRDAERMSLLEDRGDPLFNRAIAGAYSPGSSMKPILALAALKEGVVKPDSSIFSKGFIEIPNPYDAEHPSRFLDWRPQGWVDAATALARSSNIYFYAAGGGLPRKDIAETKNWPTLKGLGILRLHDYWQRFGFGAPTGIDLPGEGKGFLPEPDEKEKRTGEPWRLGDTYNVSIGQGDLLVTPLQLLSFIGSIGMRGKMYRPHVDGSRVPELALDYGDSFVSELGVVRAGLRDAVEKPYGTSHTLADLPVSVAGKTGSAQIKDNTKVNAFFVGYAPAENPEIALLVLIEDAREGSLNALPVAEDVFRWYAENRLRVQ